MPLELLLQIQYQLLTNSQNKKIFNPSEEWMIINEDKKKTISISKEKEPLEKEIGMIHELSKSIKEEFSIQEENWSWRIQENL